VAAANGGARDLALARRGLSSKQHRRAESDVELPRALAFCHSVGATRYIREAEVLVSAPA
jgi:hypothetical protein